MADSVITPIGAVEGDKSRTEAVYQMMMQYHSSEAVMTRRAAAEAADVQQSQKTADQPASQQPAKPEKPADLPVTQPMNEANVMLKFMVDDKNNVTIYVVDKSTRKVLRSIPPSEVNNLRAGDLIKLLA